MSASETQSAVLNFPIQDHDDYHRMTDYELVFLTRLAITRNLNLAALGERLLTEDDRREVHDFNARCKYTGFEFLSIKY